MNVGQFILWHSYNNDVCVSFSHTLMNQSLGSDPFSSLTRQLDEWVCFLSDISLQCSLCSGCEVYVNFMKKSTGEERLCSSFVLPVFWGRVTGVEGPAWNTHRSPLSAHTSTHAHKVMHCPGRFATQWSQCSCFCGNEEWFMFHCLEMSRHLSKLCWANGRIFFRAMCLFFTRVSTGPLLLFSPARTRHEME